MNNNKQSSVGFLIEYIKGISSLNHNEIIEQAKIMHKEEIKRAFIIGGGVEYHEINTYADEYFIEEFGGNNEQ